LAYLLKYILFEVLIQALLSCSADLVLLQSLFEHLLVLVGKGSRVDAAAADIKNEFVPLPSSTSQPMAA